MFSATHLHESHVERLKSVSGRRNEVEAAVDAVVADVATIQPRFVFEILLKLVVNDDDDGERREKEMIKGEKEKTERQTDKPADRQKER